MSARDEAPPCDLICDESGITCLYLASSYSPQDAIEEHNLDPDDAIVTEEWYCNRWTTEEERADPDLLYDLFGDYTTNGIDTSCYPSRCAPDTPGGHRYWLVEERHDHAPVDGQETGA